MCKVFISHPSKDTVIAKSFIDKVLVGALGFHSGRIGHHFPRLAKLTALSLHTILDTTKKAGLNQIIEL